MFFDAIKTIAIVVIILASLFIIPFIGFLIGLGFLITIVFIALKQARVKKTNLKD